jgi:putative transposase
MDSRESDPSLEGAALGVKKIVGYAISVFMDSMLVLEALQMALKTRKPAPGLIHHSDRGSQYASERYIRTLEKHDVQISMSRVGMATDPVGSANSP